MSQDQAIVKRLRRHRHVIGALEQDPTPFYVSTWRSAVAFHPEAAGLLDEISNGQSEPYAFAP